MKKISLVIAFVFLFFGVAVAEDIHCYDYDIEDQNNMEVTEYLSNYCAGGPVEEVEPIPVPEPPNWEAAIRALARDEFIRMAKERNESTGYTWGEFDYPW